MESAAFWNNASASGTYPSLIDSFGQPTGTTLTFAANFYTTADVAPATGDQRMMASHVGSLADSFTIQLTGVPPSYVDATYDLIVYFGAKDGSTYGPSFSVGGPTLFIRDANGTWDGVHRESTATTAAAAVQGENHVRFRNLSSADLVLTIRRGGGAQRYGISGLQIVAHPPIEPEPIRIPTILPTLATTDWRLSFTSDPSLTYQLLRAESPNGPWDPFGDPIRGDGSEIDLTLPVPTKPHEFFRLEISR